MKFEKHHLYFFIIIIQWFSNNRGLGNTPTTWNVLETASFMIWQKWWNGLCSIWCGRFSKRDQIVGARVLLRGHPANCFSPVPSAAASLHKSHDATHVNLRHIQPWNPETPEICTELSSQILKYFHLDFHHHFHLD